MCCCYGTDLFDLFGCRQSISVEVTVETMCDLLDFNTNICPFYKCNAIKCNLLHQSMSMIVVLLHYVMHVGLH